MSVPAALPVTELRPALTLGSVLKRTFSIWGQGFFAFSVVAAIAYLPVLFFWLTPVLGAPFDAILESRGVQLGGGTVLTVLTSFITAGAVTQGVIEHLRGNRADLGAMIGMAVRRGPGILAVALAVLLLFALGLALLIIPGMILNLVLWVAVPVAVVERTGVIESLKRSRALTRDQLGLIFGLLFVVNGFGRVMNMIVQGAIPTLEAVSPWLSFGVAHLVGAMLAALPAIACAVTYHDLRVLKEGSDTSALARVFE
jgi:hypothetical protein